MTVDEKSLGQASHFGDLQRTEVTDAARTRKAFSQLQSLDLRRTKVTDAALERLKELPKLQSLAVGWATR